MARYLQGRKETKLVLGLLDNASVLKELEGAKRSSFHMDSEWDEGDGIPVDAAAMLSESEEYSIKIMER